MPPSLGTSNCNRTLSLSNDAMPCYSYSHPRSPQKSTPRISQERAAPLWNHPQRVTNLEVVLLQVICCHLLSQSALAPLIVSIPREAHVGVLQGLQAGQRMGRDVSGTGPSGKGAWGGPFKERQRSTLHNVE